MTSRAASDVNLSFDADDTRCDFNVHFLDSFEQFAAAIEAAGISHPRPAVQDAVRRAELERIRIDRYGRAPHTLALHRALRELAPEELRQDLHADERIIELTAFRRLPELF
ncbi:MAG: hypothetical protein ACREQB_00605 [Candidatus Binataceae bacterium]